MKIQVPAIFVAAVVSLISGLCLHAQTATAVTPFDENRLTGTWYDIAHFPTKQEKRCNGDAVDLITRADKLYRLQWVQSCRTHADVEAHNMTARPQTKNVADGRYKVTTFWPRTKKYWVLGLDTDWALIGSPDHKSLWIYSRNAVMPAETLAVAKARAVAQGYPAESLVLSAQAAQEPAATK